MLSFFVICTNEVMITSLAKTVKEKWFSVIITIFLMKFIEMLFDGREKIGQLAVLYREGWFVVLSLRVEKLFGDRFYTGEDDCSR